MPLSRAPTRFFTAVSKSSAEEQLDALLKKCRFPTSLVYTPLFMRARCACVFTGTHAPSSLLLRFLPLPRVPVKFLVDHWHMYKGVGKYAIADPRAIQAFASIEQSDNDLLRDVVAALREKCLDLVRGLREKGLCIINPSLSTLNTTEYGLLLVATNSPNIPCIQKAYKSSRIDTSFSSHELFQALNFRSMAADLPPYTNLYPSVPTEHLSPHTPGVSHLGCLQSMYTADFLITLEQLRFLKHPLPDRKATSKAQSQQVSNKSALKQESSYKHLESSSDDD